MEMKAFLELRIEELALDGLEGFDTTRLGGAVEHELGRLLAGRGLPATFEESGNSDQLDGGALKMASGRFEAKVATQIARAVCRGLSR